MTALSLAKDSVPLAGVIILGLTFTSFAKLFDFKCFISNAF